MTASKKFFIASFVQFLLANAYIILHVARTILERLDLIKPILHLYFYGHKIHKRKTTIKQNKKRLLVSFTETMIKYS